MTDTSAPAAPAAEPVVSTAVPVTPAAEPIATPETGLIPAAAAAPAAPQRPEGLPDAFWDDASGIKPEAYARLAELEAKDAERLAALPATPQDYKLDPDEPVVGPDGSPVVADPEDPYLVAALPVLHKHGVPQAAVAEIIKDVLKAQVAEAAAVNEATEKYTAAEIAKLGPTAEAAKARTAAMHGQVIAAIGSDQAEALRAALNKSMSADGVIALEALVSKLQGPALSAAPHTPAPASLADRLYG